MRFKDQSIIVTGAGGGIGFATACLMAREGARVAVNDVDALKVEAAAECIREQGGHVLPVVADAGMETEIRSAVERVMSEWGRIDVLVNNAGIMVRKAAHEATLQEWRRGMAVNLDGPFIWAQAVATQSMIPRRQGVIVNVASIAGLVAIPNAAAYVASKHGLVGLTKAQALDWGSYNIRVNALCPGMTWTDLSKEGREKNPEYFQEREKRIPLGRAATPEEQAEAIAFLASSQSSGAHGLIMNVDGGNLSMHSGVSLAGW